MVVRGVDPLPGEPVVPAHRMMCVPDRDEFWILRGGASPGPVPHSCLIEPRPAGSVAKQAVNARFIVLPGQSASADAVVVEAPA